MRYELFAGSLEDLLHVRRTPQEYNRGDFIYRSGQPPAIYYVHAGVVRTYHVAADSGKVIHHDFHPPRTLFGESSLWSIPLDSECDVEHAVAHTKTIVTSWSADEFETMAVENRQLVDALVHLYADRHARMLARLERAETLMVSDRLRAVLFDTARRIGRIEGDAAFLPHITHEVFSSMIGTSREIVTDYLNRFRREGLIRYSRREMIIQLRQASEVAA